MKSELRIATIYRHWFREILSRFEKLEPRVDKGLKSLSKKGKLAKEGSKKVVSPLEKVIVENFDEETEDDEFLHGGGSHTYRNRLHKSRPKRGSNRPSVKFDHTSSSDVYIDMDKNLGSIR